MSKKNQKRKDPSVWRILLHYPIQFFGTWRMYLSLWHGFFFKRRRKEKPEKVIVED